MGEKLTRPQRELLNDLPCPVHPTYAPAKRLVDLGLATWVPRKYADVLELTDSGRSALQRESGE